MPSKKSSPKQRQPPPSRHVAASTSKAAAAADPFMKKVIARRFRIDRQIGEGSFGQVRLGTDLKTGKKVAIKMADLGDDQIYTEFAIYRKLRGRKGFAKVHFSGHFANLAVVVMELLGRDLESAFTKCDFKFSLKSVVFFAIEAITRLEDFHKADFIYRDIKPENFMLSLSSNEIKLIDFGLSERYINDQGLHKIEGKIGELVGTERFMSINAHLGKQQSRRDDLESLGYIFVYFLFGQLPWYNVYSDDLDRANQVILEMKRDALPSDLFVGMPLVFARYMRHVKTLDFYEEPDYAYLRKGFAQYFRETFKDVDDGVYDWNGV